MAASKNSRRSRPSEQRPDSGGWLAVLAFCAAAALILSAAAAYFYRTGATLYSGDAEAHLNIARRIIDSRTPGWNQVGTTWLPLPHLILIPFVMRDDLWRTGLAGALPAAMCMAIAVFFLFAALRRVTGNTGAAACGAAVFLLNPNTLYLGSIPMTEPVFFAGFFAMLYWLVRFAETRGYGALLGASVAACAAALSRYEAWFLLPFAVMWILWAGAGRRIVSVVIFCMIAGSGPALWLLHNRYYFGDALYFYRGPWSAMAIQGSSVYPGHHDWWLATRYFLEAARLIAGWPGLILGVAGSLVALVLEPRARWPFALLALLPVFYIWSIHSSATPIFVPTLEPHSFYNIRYAMAALPLAALGVAALSRFGLRVTAVAALAALSPFVIDYKSHSITWQEAEVNSRGRRAIIAQASQYLEAAAGPNQTYFTSFNDLTGIFRSRGIPLRNTLTGDMNPEFMGATSRPDLFLHEDWAVCIGGDPVQNVLTHIAVHGPRYELRALIAVRDQPSVEIYHLTYENPVHETARSEE
jgi:hypothetical protein